MQPLGIYRGIAVWELNEAFLPDPLLPGPLRDRSRHLERHGGAISIGHPYGMTGARLVLHALIEGQAPRCEVCRGSDVRRRRHGSWPPVRGCVRRSIFRAAQESWWLAISRRQNSSDRPGRCKRSCLRSMNFWILLSRSAEKVPRR
nr:hypothetical protein [Bradyrhizobium murdochi]